MTMKLPKIPTVVGYHHNRRLANYCLAQPKTKTCNLRLLSSSSSSNHHRNFTTLSIQSSAITSNNNKNKNDKNHNHCHSLYGNHRNYGTIPIVLESGTMGERSFDIYSRLLRERIICVHGEITDAMSSVVTAQLLFLEAEGPKKPVYMYINSPGGSVTAGMAIYDTMQYIQPNVHTIGMGQCASMGSLLLAGGTAGCRKALPHAQIMVHQPSGGAQGMASDIFIRSQELLRIRARLNNLYKFHTGQALEDIERVMDRDTFMTAEQAMEFGMIDEILIKRKVDNNDDDDDN